MIFHLQGLPSKLSGITMRN